MNHVKQETEFSVITSFRNRSFLSMFVLVMILTLLSFSSWYHLNRVQQLPHSIAHAAERITLTTQIIRPMCGGGNESIEKDFHIGNIVKLVDQLLLVHQSLLFDLGDYEPSAGRFLVQDELHFSNDFVTKNGTLGLHVLLEQYLNSVQHFVTLVQLEDLTLTSPIVLRLLEQRPKVSLGMIDSIDFYHDETFSAISSGLITVRSMFGFSVVTIVVLYFFVFRRMVKSLETEQDSTSLLLEMFPEESLANNKTIKTFLSYFVL
ncbi:hypothetical protein GEMRC1_005693 [Eukaryota sp. GEM-RC1]